MKFTRLDDDVAMGIGGSDLYAKGETYEIEDINLAAQLLADPGWRCEDELTVPDPPTDEAPPADGEEVTSDPAPTDP